MLTYEEVKELRTIDAETKQAVLSLEVCFLCERVTECLPGTVDDATVWICLDCDVPQIEVEVEI